MAVVITQTANPAGVSASSNVATYTGASIGTATGSRIVVVVVGCELASTPIASCTIGGNAMTAGTGGNRGAVYSQLFYLAYPTGTTADIAVTFTTNSPSSTQNHIAVYSVTGGVYSSKGGDASTDMDSTDPLTTGSTTIAADGGMLAIAAGATDTNAKTWANLNEDIDADAGAFRFTTAFSTTAGTATRTVTGTSNGEDGALSWIIFTANVSPTVALNTPADAAKVADTTPLLDFTGTDTESNDVRYEVQIHTDNTFLTQIASDNFNRANGGLGGNWTTHASRSNPVIVSNAVSAPADDDDATGYWTGSGSFSDNQYSQATITWGDAAGTGTSYAGLLLRSGATSTIYCQKDRPTGDTVIVDVTSLDTSPSYSEVGRSTTEIANGSVVRAEVIGSKVYIYDDGALVLTATTSLTTGKPGILLNDDTDVIDNWSGGNTTPLIDAVSGTDAGFANPDTGGDTDPFNSGENIQYTVQSALTPGTTYYWRVRGIDPSGSNLYGAWATTRSFTILTAALTGTVTASITETDIVTGGKTIILTLTGDTWIAAGGASFDLQRDEIIAGIDSAQSEATGWDLVPKATQSVTGVVRTSDTVVTLTLDAFATYNITAQETITATIPATALTGGVAVVASPAFTVDTAGGAPATYVGSYIGPGGYF